MSALYRLKAYFGMVPVEDFDDYYPDYHSAEHRSGYDSGYDVARNATESDHVPERSSAGRVHKPDLVGYDDGFVAPSGRPAASRMHPSRPATWATEAPMRGSLAIDTAPPIRQPATPAPPANSLVREPFADNEAVLLSRIVTLHPHNYNEARPIGERYREGNPVIMNLTGMEDRDAKRLVDFAAGLAFALRGSIDKVTNKVFLLSPPNVEVSAEDRRRIAEGRLFS